MKSKFEVFQIFVNSFYLVKNQFWKYIKRVSFHNGTKYVNHEFSKFFPLNGIVSDLTCVNTP